MDIKSCYKLYKVGKLWVTALISAAVLGIASTAHADTDQSQSAQGAGEQATADVESNHAAAQIQQSQVALNSQPTSPVTGNQKAANERSAMQNVAKDGSVSTSNNSAQASN